MFNVNKTNYVSWLHSQMQTIAEELDKPSLSNKKFNLLSRQIDTAVKVLDQIKEQAKNSPFAQATTAELEERILKLTGRVVDAWMKNEVHTIHHEAVTLEHSMQSGKITAQAVKNLAKHLNAFKKEHRPLAQERRLIAEAELIMHRAQAHLDGHIVKPKKERQILDEGFESVSAEEVGELIDICFYLEKRDLKEARMRFLQLPQAHKNRFYEHMQNLNATAFTDLFETTQAFFAIANELAKNGNEYPTREEIAEFFAELPQQLQTQDKMILKNSPSRYNASASASKIVYFG